MSIALLVLLMDGFTLRNARLFLIANKISLNCAYFLPENTSNVNQKYNSPIWVRLNNMGLIQALFIPVLGDEKASAEFLIHP